MAFDGEDHRASRPIFPVEYYPGSPFAPGAISAALTTAYVHVRRASRLMIATAYPRNLQSPASDRDTPDTVSSTSYVPVCDGYRYVSPYYTHVSGRVLIGVQPTVSSTVSARIKVTRGIVSTAWAIVSNVLTITMASGHGFDVGDLITFDSATLDLTTEYTIESTPSATEVSVAYVAADSSATEAGVVYTTDTGTASSITIEPPAYESPPADADPALALAIAQYAAVNARMAPYDDQAVTCFVELVNCPAGGTYRIILEAKCVTVSAAAQPWRPYSGTAWAEIRDV